MATQFTTTDSKLYIVELTPPYSRLAIQFYPDEIPEQRKIITSDTGVVGYNNSGTNYTGGDNIINLKLDFYADETEPQEAIKKAEWLKSLGYSDGFAKGQPLVKIIWGTMFKGRTWQAVGDINLVYKGFHKGLANNMARIIQASVTFKEVVSKATTLADIRQARNTP